MDRTCVVFKSVPPTTKPQIKIYTGGACHTHVGRNEEEDYQKVIISDECQSVSDYLLFAEILS